MAISDTCKFEFKTNVDRVQKERRISRRKAIALIADEIGLIEETARKMDQRARKELGQIVPTTKPPENTTEKSNLKKLEKPKSHGGKRQGSGRKKKPEPVDMVSEEFQTAWDQMFTALSNAKQLKWRDTSQYSAVKMIEVLYDMATITSDSVFTPND